MALIVGVTNQSWWELWQIGGRSLKKTPFVGRFPDMYTGVNYVAFSHAGSEVVAGGDDGMFAVWSVAQRRRLWMHSSSTSADQTQIWHILFSPDDQTIVSAASDDTVRLWNAKTGRLLRVLHASGKLLFSPDGATLIIAGEDATIQLWDAKTGQLRRAFAGGKAMPSPMRQMAITRDGTILAVGEPDGVVSLWNLH